MKTELQTARFKSNVDFVKGRATGGSVAAILGDGGVCQLTLDTSTRMLTIGYRPGRDKKGLIRLTLVPVENVAAMSPVDCLVRDKPKQKKSDPPKPQPKPAVTVPEAGK